MAPERTQAQRQNEARRRDELFSHSESFAARPAAFGRLIELAGKKR